MKSALACRRVYALGCLVLAAMLVGRAGPGMAGGEAVRLTGQLEEGYEGRLRLKTADGEVDLKGFAGFEKRKTLIGIPLQIVGVRGGTTVDPNVEFVSAEPGRLLKQWHAEAGSGRQAHADDLVLAFNHLDRAYLEAAAGMAGSGIERYSASLGEVSVAIGQALLRDPADAGVLALARHTASEQRLAYKAKYRIKDLYNPQVYQRIHEHSRGGCALVNVYTTDVYASGVLVGKDVVLTCHHCLWSGEPGVGAKLTPDLISVRFDYEELDQGALPTRDFPVKEILVEGAWKGGLDYALLRIGADVHGNFPEPARIQALTARPVRLNDALYVVGHPEGKSRQIADNCHVLFPYEIDDATLAELATQVAARARGDREAATQLRMFFDSYPPAPPGPLRRHLSRRFDGSPAIGADCDTYHGNSGSAAHLKLNHLVIGIVFRGEEDVEEAYEPGWMRHEGIVPASAILEDLATRKLDAVLGDLSIVR